VPPNQEGVFASRRQEQVCSFHEGRCSYTFRMRSGRMFCTFDLQFYRHMRPSSCICFSGHKSNTGHPELCCCSIHSCISSAVGRWVVLKQPSLLGPTRLPPVAGEQGSQHGCPAVEGHGREKAFDQIETSSQSSQPRAGACSSQSKMTIWGRRRLSSETRTDDGGIKAILCNNQLDDSPKPVIRSIIRPISAVQLLVLSHG
jgi:hypothetical protein